MASSSSSPLKRSMASPKLYDVFISHSPDVKDTLAKQLYELLRERGCRVSMNLEEMEGGDSIPVANRNCICSSTVQIAIFSKGYAESSCCLNELVLILEQTDALFIPMFDDVKPWELRYINEKSQYTLAFSAHQSNRTNLDRLDIWKKALASAANISGYERSQHQEDLCEEIVFRVMQEMQKRAPLGVAKYPIALDEIVKDFEMSCPQTAGLVGIFGLGGSGKTTLAKELFNRQRATTEFEASSFLSDVRESYANRELHSLQIQLFKDLFHEDAHFNNRDEGTARLKYRLAGARGWRFLIVLDDIDQQEQLDALLPELLGMLSSGSLVIITTRDQSVLMALDVSTRYKMKPLDRAHAKELFCSHAFPTRDPPTTYEKLVESFVEFCGGLPLSLIVLGAHIRGRDEHYWKSELEKVEKIPSEEIIKRLKISFDGLDEEEKQIFVDIACFFNKHKYFDIHRWIYAKETFSSSWDDPSRIHISAFEREMSFGEIVPLSIWKTSGWSAEYAIQNLQDKCLIEVKVEDVYWWSIEMHDHLRDLGRQMADDMDPPRLWKPDTLRSMEAKGFKHILEETKSRCFNSIWDSSLASTLMYFIGSLNDSAETQLLWLEINRGVGSLEVPLQISLRKMHCLDETTMTQLLRPWIPIRILCYSNDSDKPQLMWLERNGGAGGSLQEIPSWIPLQKLQYLALDDMEGLWNSFQQQMQSNFQASFELRRLHIFGSPLLQKLPDLRQLERLNTLEVERCHELETISGLSSLTGLRSLKLYRCTKLETISELSCLIGLQSLHVEKCYRVETIPEMSSLRGLQSLHVQECYRLETISGLSSLTGLQSLHVQECLRLKTISGISSIIVLQFLHVQECPMMETIFNLSSLTELGSIHMQGYTGDCFKYELVFSEEFNVANLRYLERIAILGCCQLQSVQGFEELQGLKSLAIEVPQNGYAWVRNCVYTLRMLPSECTVLIGNAVEEAMSRLNLQLFSEMIDGPAIHEIDKEDDTVNMSSSWSAITIHALLCECGQIKVSAKIQNPYTYYFNSPRGGQVMFTIILPQQSQLQFTVDGREFGFRGKVVKGFKATLNGGEEGKALTVLQGVVDRLYR